jgi:hypothetical protein
MGRYVADMVEAATFFGIVMLACVTILVIGMTLLLALMWWDLVKDMWNKMGGK